MNWQRQGSVLAWPYSWQQPNKTEEWAYERCLAGLKHSPFVEMLCFPWATLIDVVRKGQHGQAEALLQALHWAPPRRTLRRATVMQHIWARDMLPHLTALGITDVYWSHATKQVIEWPGGIRLHPFALYPVCCGTDIDTAAKVTQARPYLYSFIGAYEPGLYLSSVRQWIFDLPHRTDARIERRSEWHYQGLVYRGQIEGQQETANELAERQAREHEYQRVLAQSVFSLCPSGSGPNSIRLWESIGLGAIPVIIADDLWLAGEKKFWAKAAIFVPETRNAVLQLPALLDKEFSIGAAHLESRRAALRQLWSEVCRPNFSAIYLR